MQQQLIIDVQYRSEILYYKLHIFTINFIFLVAYFEDVLIVFGATLLPTFSEQLETPPSSITAAATLSAPVCTLPRLTTSQ
mmetsp:Transcript_42077/g.101182  ORF Transcript_42077/g.101182 Transcript_42077/m.101182 type:complete len:81 (+) Transcript_42077:33-275(+)